MPFSSSRTELRGSIYTAPLKLDCSVRRAGRNPRGRTGRQFVHGCPYLPGNLRAWPGPGPDADLYIFLSIPRVLQYGTKVWRSARDN
eukprot:314682-Pyramimonas_sp.AAC.1